MRVLITGGCGFIGTAVTEQLLQRGNQVLNLDKMTYAANPEALRQWEASDLYDVIVGDISNLDQVISIFEEFKPDCVIHSAAETHVDRSIDGAAEFLQTNFVGTFTLLEAARFWWSGRGDDHRFHMISTDEVYGSLGPGDAAFTESSSFRPNSPYAASKAAASHLVRAWGQTYNLPVVTTYCSNNYGPWQFPEKLIPLMITKGVEGRPLPIYGTGENVRDWVHVADHAAAVRLVLEHGTTGESYNIGGAAEHTNANVVDLICKELDIRMPENGSHSKLITHVADRAGHDWRYAVDTSKIRDELGWEPETDFQHGLAETVDWYLSNRSWWEAIIQNRYQGERLGRHAA